MNVRISFYDTDRKPIIISKLKEIKYLDENGKEIEAITDFNKPFTGDSKEIRFVGSEEITIPTSEMSEIYVFRAVKVPEKICGC
ncbi:MAG: hypothetical protein GX219_00330 [Tissierellia bacterium]|nr:hypothetical protein [Tissierellia bacterium]